MHIKINLYLIAVMLSLLGIAIMSYFVYEQYFSPAQTYLCDLNDKFSCSYLSQTPYAYLFGIHISVFGLVWFIIVGIGSYILLRKKHPFKMHLPLYAFVVFGFLFSFYLQIVEFFVVKVICILCVITFIVVSFILLIHSVYFYRFHFTKS